MVNQYTQQQQQLAPQQASPNLSPAQWAQLSQLAAQQQSAYQPQGAPPSTSAYTSSGTMSAIDPALLQNQWLQYQQGQLAQSAIIPQYQPQTQYAPQQQGEYVSSESIAAITEFIHASAIAANAAAEYIGYLQSSLSNIGSGYKNLVEFSAAQDALIERFLFDRDFALDYARGTWANQPVSNEFMSKLADVYLEIDSVSPRNKNDRNPEFTGSPVQFSAQLQPQNLIPPLPNNNGNTAQSITMEQYLIAQQQGQVGQARASALQNPAGLYAALFQ